MTSEHPQPQRETIAALAGRASVLAAEKPRTLLGIAGAPGAGKSTLGADLVRAMGTTARVVGMDGFHLAKSRLVELGRLDRMGAIDTFDAWGFVALLRRLRDQRDETVYAPEFRRGLEEPIAGAIAIEPDAPLVIVEGNYLLIADEPWGELRSLLDEVWYCERDERERISGLIARHRTFGKTEEEARRWVLGPDQRNAELVATTRATADMIVRLDGKPVDAAPAL